VMLGQLVSVFTLLVCVLVPLCIHKVDEGFVGVYYRGGALMGTITEPGYHLKVPIMTTMDQVQVTVQTDAVTDIPCGTSGGVMISFGKIEVVNRLHKENVLDTVKNYTVDYDKLWIFDRVHHEINQFCSNHSLQEVYIDQFDTLDEELIKALTVAIEVYAPGIEIISVRVTKPQIPRGIALNYEMMEAQKAQYKIAMQHQKVVEREAQTDRERAKIEAQQVAAVEIISVERQIAEKQGQQEVEKISSEMHVARAKATADSMLYKVTKEAEGNAAKLTADYVKLEAFKAAVSNATLFFGDAIPSTLLMGTRGSDVTLAGSQ